jgi:hypothetical protein
MVFSCLASKLVAMVSPDLVLKLMVGSLIQSQNKVVGVSRLGPQNQQLWFGDLCLKISATVSWFGPQNQVGYGLSIAPQNRWEGDSVGHALRSTG